MPSSLEWNDSGEGVRRYCRKCPYRDRRSERCRISERRMYSWQCAIFICPRKMHSAGVKDGDIVSVKADNERGTIFNQVKIRVDDSFTLEMHIDTDEANAARIATGNTVTIIK